MNRISIQALVAFTAALLLTLLAALHAADAPAVVRDAAIESARIVLSPSPQEIPPTKRQGVPGIERTTRGRLWAIYGRHVESTRTYQVVKTSDDDGRSWSEVRLMILPHPGTRAMSACLWVDPQGRLWIFWGQSAGLQDGRFGVWAMTTDDPDAAEPKWSEPRHIGDGILLNKPTVLESGDWLLAVSIWKTDHSLRMYASTDQGKSFQLRGTANVLPPESRGPDEPMIVERKDGSLWMLVRSHGIKETTSLDGGRTWSPVSRLAIPHPTSRFFVRRLRSGSLLLVKHGPIDEKVRREKLMAFVSDDDGRTWQGGLMLDERNNVTYPDGVQAENGTIYIVYDYNRTPDGAVLMAAFGEEDARAGKPVSDKVRLRVEVARLPAS